jgi:hypothetical protein
MRAELPPRRVLGIAAKRRVFERFAGCCAGCGAEFASIEAVNCWDHGVQRWLADGPDDVSLEDEANFRPLCEPCRKIKDARDAFERGKARRLNGTTPKRRKGPPIRTRGFRKDIKRRFNGQIEKRT